MACSMDGCHLILHHSFPFVPVINEANIPDPISIVDLEQEQIRRLTDLRTVIQPLAGPATRITCKTSRKSVLDAASDLVREFDVYLTLIGSKERSRVSELLLGSTTEEMVKHFASPLLVIPPDVVFHRLKLALLACDWKVSARFPFNVITSLLTEWRSELIVLHVDPHPVDELVTEEILGAEEIRYHFARFAPEYLSPNTPDVAGEITRVAQKYEPDVLILVHQEHNFFYRLLHRSTALRLTVHGNCPVLVLKEGNAETEGERVKVKAYS